MSKLRLDYFLSLGLKLHKKDEYIFKGRSYVITDEDNAFVMSRTDFENQERFITSFVPRKNEGAQPCGDGVPVVVEYDDGGEYSELASDLTWNKQALKSWKPNLYVLTKMQAEHDAKQVKPFLQTGESFEHTKTLNFILERMVNVHGEHESVDYIHKLRNAIIFVEQAEDKTPKQAKPRTKAQYVECETLQSALDDFESKSGIEFYCSIDGVNRITSVKSLALAYGNDSLYRKVETEITWQDAFQEFIFDNEIGLDIVCDSISKTNKYGELEIKQGEKSYNINGITEEMLLKMCHLVESMTDRPE
jgi:hypothetical protein